MSASSAESSERTPTRLGKVVTSRRYTSRGTFLQSNAAAAERSPTGVNGVRHDLRRATIVETGAAGYPVVRQATSLSIEGPLDQAGTSHCRHVLVQGAEGG